MNDRTLGRLTPVELRDIWSSEASDFTPWLAREENLSILGEVLGVELELEAQERAVGPFRADILCKDIGSGAWVLVENQLERSDHLHLGQLLTYASGVEAVTIVWIAARFTEEHRSTLDWLNKITDESFRFFGLEVELWRIGESPAAPKFNVVSKPNNWSRSVAQAARAIDECRPRRGEGDMRLCDRCRRFSRRERRPHKTAHALLAACAALTAGFRSRCSSRSRRSSSNSTSSCLHDGTARARTQTLSKNGDASRMNLPLRTKLPKMA